MPKVRNNTIDILRGLGLFSVIFIHALAYYLNDKTAHFLWNYSQFAVQVFVFCSGYIFFVKYVPQTNFNWISYFIKRIKRLIIPYYIFLLLFLPIVFFTEPKKIQIPFIIDNLLVKDGIDINWLILLFIQLTLVTIFLKYAINKKRILFYLYTALSFLSSFIFLFYVPPINYKLYMWLPWSLILIYCYYFTAHEKNKKFFIWTAFIFLGVYISTLVLKQRIDGKLVFFDNKYPPNTYYLFYGLFSLNILYLLIQKDLFKPFQKFLSFLSIHSYELFFIHYAAIYIVSTRFPYTTLHWSVFFIIILFLSVGIQLSINAVSRLYGKRFRSSNR